MAKILCDSGMCKYRKNNIIETEDFVDFDECRAEEIKIAHDYTRDGRACGSCASYHSVFQLGD